MAGRTAVSAARDNGSNRPLQACRSLQTPIRQHAQQQSKALHSRTYREGAGRHRVALQAAGRSLQAAGQRAAVPRGARGTALAGPAEADKRLVAAPAAEGRHQAAGRAAGMRLAAALAADRHPAAGREGVGKPRDAGHKLQAGSSPLAAHRTPAVPAGHSRADQALPQERNSWPLMEVHRKPPRLPPQTAAPPALAAASAAAPAAPAEPTGWPQQAQRQLLPQQQPQVELRPTSCGHLVCRLTPGLHLHGQPCD